MKLYIKIFLDYFDYDIADFIPCENCNKKAVNIHHISKRGMGGTKTKDYIENLAAVCMKCHNRADNDPKFNEQLKKKHLINVKKRRIQLYVIKHFEY